MKSTSKLIGIIAAGIMVLLTAALPLAAEGVQERQDTRGTWQRGSWAYGPQADGSQAAAPGAYGPGMGRPGMGAAGLPVVENLSLTGRLEFTAAHPILKTDEGSYRLMYPLFLGQEADIKNGQEISVEGFVVPGPRWEDDGESEEKYLRVSKAIIDDREYLIGGPNPGGRPGMAGRDNFSGRPGFRQNPGFQQGPGARGGRR